MNTGGAAVFDSLTGAWHLERVIEPGIGTMAGAARFRPLRAGLLHYREDGRLRLASGHTGAAYREYFYVLDEAAIHICFAVGGQPGDTMHTLRPDTAGDAADTHLCRADQYTGRYRFPGPDQFSVHMRVTGPEKHYWIVTAYRRAAGGAAGGGDQ